MPGLAREGPRRAARGRDRHRAPRPARRAPRRPGHGLPAVAAQAPRDLTLVVYHCSVLYQVPPQGREQFAAAVRDLGASWVSAEDPGIVPGTDVPAVDDQMYVLARDGQPLPPATATERGWNG